MAAANDSAALRVQLDQLQQQLAEERQLRRQAEEAVEALAADRNRLQKARDELATALLAAERRASEAEEEQLRAETQAAAMERALREHQHATEIAAAATAAAGSAPPVQDASQREVAAPSPIQRGETEADLEILLAELDRERARSEELVRTLEAAEREAVAATDKLLKAQQRIKALESGGGKRGLFGGKKAAPAATPATTASEALPEGATAEEAVAVLQQRIAALKASRDKLIGAFDAQAAEIERLSGDNAALAESLAQLRDVAAKWEAQAQGSLAQTERLKDLLEESATWSPPVAPQQANGAAPPGKSTGGGGGSDDRQQAASGAAGARDERRERGAAVAAGGEGGELAALCQRFERELLLEKARSAQLDLQVRALCMELTRAAQSSASMRAALLPMLGGVEARLVQVLGMRPRGGVLQAATA